MRAINLVPADSRPGRVNGGKSGGAVYAVLGVLVIALLGLSVLAMSKRDESRATQELTSVEQSTAAYSSVATKFSSFETAAAQATERINLVRGLADARFDWAGSLRDLSRLIPADTQISELSASVKQGGSVGGGSGMRSALAQPAISLNGCSKSQTTVANLITQLQAMRRVTNVALESSATETADDVSEGDAANKPGEATEPFGGAASGAPSDSGDAAAADTGGSCSLDKPFYTFTLVIFFAQGKAQSSADVAPSAAGAAGGTTIASESAGGTTPATPTTTTPGN